MSAKPFYRNLTFQVLSGICLGALIGFLFPEFAVQLKVLGDLFIKLIKMLIGPVVFLTIVSGISAIGDMKRVGRVGGKALLYFEVVTTLALAIGLVVVNVLRPGDGIHLTSDQLAEVAKFHQAAQEQSVSHYLLNIIPDTLISAFVSGELLQILFVAILTGAALTALGKRGEPILNLLESLLELVFKIVNYVMIVAPIGAFGAMAFTIGKFGFSALKADAELMASVYLTMIIFIFLILGFIMRWSGFRLLRFLRYIRDEILLVLGTSSSETALPSLIEKLEKAGCAPDVVGLVVPMGYSFNLDGTSIYMSMGTIFIAQAYHIHLSLQQQLSILLILMLTSKGAAGVTGSGFITLAATLSATGVLPVEGLALLLGVDRFMSEARAITNLIGNGVATMVISRLEGAIDSKRARFLF